MSDFDVCFIANHAINFVLEGHNIASVRIIESAINSGIDAKIVTLEKSIENNMKNYISIRTFSSAKRKTTIYPPLGEFISSFNATIQAKKIESDIIHLLNVTKEIFYIMKKFARINKPYIAHLFHSSYPFSVLYKNFQFRNLLLKIGFFDNIFCSSKSLLKYLLGKPHINPEKIFYVPYPIDIQKFKPQDKQKLREKYRFPIDAPIILYVGHIDPYRGFHRILHSYQKILNEIPDTLLYICHPNLKGQEERYASYFNSMSKSKKSNIVVSGPSSHIEDAYSLADVIVLPFEKPYWITAPPLVFQEAMASGTPIVTTPLDEIKEIGKDGKNVFFTKPGDVDSISRSISCVLKNIDLANEVGLNARNEAINTFSMDVVGSILADSYKKIINY